MSEYHYFECIVDDYKHFTKGFTYRTVMKFIPNFEFQYDYIFLINNLGHKMWVLKDKFHKTTTAKKSKNKLYEIY